MNRKPRILVVGSFVMDVIATTHVVPGRGEAVYGSAFHTACGGKGVNQAVQCARLGAEVTIVGCVGNDSFGAELLENVQREGVNCAHVRTIDGVTTGVGHITLEMKNQVAQNRIIVIPGANLSVNMDDVSWLEEQIGQFDAVLLQLEIPPHINLAVARWAHQAGVTVLLNPAPATELEDQILPLVSYLIPNEQEAAQETGLPLGITPDGVNQGDLDNILQALRNRGASNIIVTLGEHGSVLSQGSDLVQISSVLMDTVADPTGAGDSFVGALAMGLTSGLPLTQALTFASHTAALTVTKMGAMPSLPTLAQVNDLLTLRSPGAVTL